MGKSSSAPDRQSAKSPLHHLASDPKALRLAHAAVHRFVEQLEAEVEDAVQAARARQLAAIREIEQAVRYLHARCLTGHVAAPRKPRGLTIEPDFILALKALDAAPLAGCVSAIREAIIALEPYEGVRFNRKPIGKHGSPTVGPEESALADLERVGQDLLGLFRGLADRLASRCMTRTRRKTPKAGASGPLTPPQVAKRLGVSADKVRAWIAKGELIATNVAKGSGGRPRYRVSETDLADFQRKRQPSKPPAPAPRRKKKDPHVIEFFK